VLLWGGNAALWRVGVAGARGCGRRKHKSVASGPYALARSLICRMRRDHQPFVSIYKELCHRARDSLLSCYALFV